MGSKGSNTTTASFKPPKEFMDAYKEALGMARTATSQPYQQYEGQLVAGLTPSQRQGIANVNAAQGMALPAIQQGMQYTNQAAAGITPELYQRFYSPYVKDVANTTFANLMESQAQQQSNLKGGAIGAGAFGGDRAGIAQAEMARQQQLANAMSMSNIYNQGYGQAMGLAGQQVSNLGAMGQQLAGLGAGAQASVLQGAQAQMAAGAQEQATEQARLQAAYEQWMQRQSYPYQQAQFFANIAQGLGAGAGGTSSTTAPAPNMFSQILGGIGAIGSIYGASDKRVKENIEAVGKLNDGQTIYRYNFKGDPKTQIGLLAQEVEHHKPGAVAEIKGLKMVNYKDATEDSASMGGVVGPSEFRQGLAGGGEIPYHPYGDARSYVPEGKAGGQRANIPKAPDAFEDKGLAADWKELMPLSKEQATGLRKLASDVGIDLPEKGDIAAIFKKNALGHSAPEEAYYDLANSDAQYAMPWERAAGGLVGRQHYAGGGGSMMDRAIDEAAGLGAAPEPVASDEAIYPTPEEVEAYIASAAQKRGIDPDVAVRVWRSEGRSGDPREAWQSKVINKKGEREESYGPYQLYMKGGLGNEMLKETGLSPADPRNWKPSVDFSLDKAAVGGWSPWHGAKAIGLDDRAGLANAKALGEYSSPDSGVVPVPASAEGLAAAGDEAPAPESGGLLSRIKFDPSKLIASEDNPSLIEKIMGRRLSPEARAAVMNASFALMAGRSPFFATNLGEAGKVGVQTYYNALQQDANIAKQQADIARQGYEAQTGRMQAGGQLAGIVGPIYKAIAMWQADPNNAGKPLPEWIRYQLDYLRQLGFSSPESIGGDASGAATLQAPVGGSSSSSATPAVPTSEPVIGGSAESAPTSPSSGMPPATGSEAVSADEQPAPSVSAAPAIPKTPEAANFFDQTLGADNLTNPFYQLRMAKNLYDQGLFEESKRYRDEGNRLLAEIAKNKTITTSNGEVVNVPSALTAAAEVARTNAAADAYQKSVNQIFEDYYSAPLRTYSQTYQTLANAADVLREYETGSLANFKGQIAGVMNSLGLPVTQDQLDAASDNQKFTKLIIGNLLNSGLRQNLGNVALGELEIAMKGTANAENQPAANRSIIGVSMGLLNWQKDRAIAIGKFIKKNGGTSRVDPIDLQDFVSSWDQKVPQYTEAAIANTPVKGELNFNDPSSRRKAKPGYKYVIPKGNYPIGKFDEDTIVTYTGEGFEVEE